jgi:hypothetical protein
MGLPSNLTLNDAASIKTSGEKLQAALKAVRDAYRALAPGRPGHDGGQRRRSGLSDQPDGQLSGRPVASDRRPDRDTVVLRRRSLTVRG